MKSPQEVALIAIRWRWIDWWMYTNYRRGIAMEHCEQVTLDRMVHQLVMKQRFGLILRFA